MSEILAAQPLPPAGWYPDPAGTGHQRWWDGRAWQQYAPAPIVVRPAKDTAVAYVLCLFLGGFGVHHFYLGNVGQGVAQLLMTLLGWALAGFFFIGFLILIPLWIWLIVDLFLIPSYVRQASTPRY